MAQVTSRPNEAIDSLLKRFSRKVLEGGILRDCREHRWFVSKGEQDRMNKKRSIRRLKRREAKRIARDNEW